MSPYLFIILFSSSFSFINYGQNSNLLKKFFIIFSFLIFLIFIGTRNQISADWTNYILEYYYDDFRVKLSTELFSDILILIFREYSLDFSYFVLAQSFIVTICLFIFLRKVKFPFLALTVSIPVLISIIFMGYIKQSLAVAISLLAVMFLLENKNFKFIVLLILSSFFHISSILLMPLVLFNKNIHLKIIATIFLILFIIGFSFTGILNTYFSEYIYYRAQSYGAPIRTFLNFLPFIFLIIFKKKWKRNYNNYELLFSIGLLNLFIFILSFIFSNLMDRLSFYLIFYQLIIYGNLPYLILNLRLRYLFIFFILFQTFLIYFIWLHFGFHNNWWLPYNSMLYNECIIECGNSNVVEDSILKNILGKLY